MHMAMACLREIAPVPTACAGGPQGLGSIFWDWVGQGSLWGLSSHAAVVSLSPSAGCAKLYNYTACAASQGIRVLLCSVLKCT